MKKIVFLVASAVSAILVSASCSKMDDPVSPGKTNDPQGTVTVNLRNDGIADSALMGKLISDKWGSTANCEIYLDRANNLNPLCSKAQKEIVYLGKGTSLGSINTDKLPETGWARKAAAMVGGLYIIHFQTCDDPTVTNDGYFGLQVVDTIVSTENGILGYTVKFCPFTPGKGWNQ